MPEYTPIDLLTRVREHEADVALASELAAAELADELAIEAAIEAAAAQIAGGFSVEAQAEYDARIERLKRRTWGDA